MVSRRDAIARAVEELRAGARKTGKVIGTSGSKVVVTVDGASMTLPKMAHYTPVTVNDVVLIDTLVPGAWIVMGRPLP